MLLTDSSLKDLRTKIELFDLHYLLAICSMTYMQGQLTSWQYIFISLEAHCNNIGIVGEIIINFTVLSDNTIFSGP